MDDKKRIEGEIGNARASEGGSGGIIQTWIDGSVDTVQAVLTGTVDVLDQARTQLTERVAQTLDWAEGFPRAGFTMARQLNRGIDAIAAQSIGTMNRVGTSVLSAMRRTGHGARDLASDATTSIIGQRAKDGAVP